MFGDVELPVLFAHGQHNRPDSVVLATKEYRQAYAGKLPQVLARLMDGHLVWIGFSFADQRIAAILREIADRTGTRIDPGGAPRHVALMAWEPAGAGNEPEILARRAEIDYGAQVVLYPAPGGDHSALVLLLETLTDARFPAAGDLPSRPDPARAGSSAAAQGPTDGPGGRGVTGGRDLAAQSAGPAEDAILSELGPGGRGLPVSWVPPPEPVAHFTGRAEELARLDRWAADPQVSLIGVTAWGGAGKTALVTHWVQEAGGASRRPEIRGVFGWSFYTDPSAEHWADALLKWVAARSRHRGGRDWPAWRRRCWRCCGRCRCCWCWMGWRVVQEGPAGGRVRAAAGRHLREVLAGACQLPHGGLVVLTSRFPFADLETFDGGSARMLEVPPFTPAEGSHCWPPPAAAGWLDDAAAGPGGGGGRARPGGQGTGCAAGRPPARQRPGRAARRPGRRGPHRRPGGQGAGASTPPGWPRQTGTCSPRCRCSPGPVTAEAVLTVAAP